MYTRPAPQMPLRAGCGPDARVSRRWHGCAKTASAGPASSVTADRPHKPYRARTADERGVRAGVAAGRAGRCSRRSGGCRPGRAPCPSRGRPGRRLSRFFWLADTDTSQHRKPLRRLSRRSKKRCCEAATRPGRDGRRPGRQAAPRARRYARRERPRSGPVGTARGSDRKGGCTAPHGQFYHGRRPRPRRAKPGRAPVSPESANWYTETQRPANSGPTTTNW